MLLHNWHTTWPEVDMPRRIDQMKQKVLSHMFVNHTASLGFNSDPPLSLNI
jgi:hypothetical protein